MKMVRLSTLCIFQRLSRRRVHVAPGRIMSMPPSGSEPAFFLLVAHCLNQLRHRVFCFGQTRGLIYLPTTEGCGGFSYVTGAVKTMCLLPLFETIRLQYLMREQRHLSVRMIVACCCLKDKTTVVNRALSCSFEILLVPFCLLTFEFFWSSHVRNHRGFQFSTPSTSTYCVLLSLSMQSVHEVLTVNALWKSNFCPPGYLRGEKY